MTLSKAIGIPATIIAVILIILFFISAPSMEMSMYHTNDSGDFKSNTFSQKDIKQTIQKEDKNKFSNWSPVCFRIKNTAQEVQAQTKLTASNFRVEIKTNAICENCNTFTDYTKLMPQELIEPCKNIKISEDLDQVIFEVNVFYDAIIPRYESSKFICDIIEEKENRNNYICNIHI